MIGNNERRHPGRNHCSVIPVRAPVRPISEAWRKASGTAVQLSRWALYASLVGSFLFPLSAFAAGCTYDTSTSAAGARNATTLTYSFTPSAASDATVVVGVNELQLSATSPSSVTYNGSAMTRVTHTNAGNPAIDTSIWILYVGTTDGAAHNVIVTGTAGTLSLVSGASSYTGTSPTQTGAFSTGAGTSGTASASLTTTAANSCVGGVIFVNDTIAHAPVTPVSPTVTDWSKDSDAASSVQGDGGHQTATSISSQTLSWTFASNLWQEAITEILPAASVSFIKVPNLLSWGWW